MKMNPTWKPQSILAAFLILLASMTVASADNILIYKGGATRSINGIASHIALYVIFDLTTLEFNSVQYYEIHRAKFYELSNPIAFVNCPFSSGPKKIHSTLFEFGYSSVGTNTVIDCGSFSGVDSPFLLAATSYPETFSYYEIYGESTTTSGTVISYRGPVVLSRSLTNQSNTAGDDLATATGIITSALQNAGYSSN